MQFNLYANDPQGKIHLVDKPIKMQETVIEQTAKEARKMSLWINHSKKKKKKNSHC